MVAAKDDEKQNNNSKTHIAFDRAMYDELQKMTQTPEARILGLTDAPKLTRETMRRVILKYWKTNSVEKAIEEGLNGSPLFDEESATK